MDAFNFTASLFSIISGVVGLGILSLVYSMFTKRVGQKRADLNRYYKGERGRLLQQWTKILPYVTLFSGVASEDSFYCTIARDEDGNPRTFHLPPVLRDHADRLWTYHASSVLFGCPIRRERELFPGELAGVLDYEYEAGKHHMEFQKCQYRDYVATNLSIGKDLVPRLTWYWPLDWFQDTVRDLLEPGPELKKLNSANCSNHLGLSCLLTTQDGFMVIAKRSRTVVIDPGKLGPSASGALEFSDICPQQAPHAFVGTPFLGIRKEIYQELAVKRDELSDLRCIGVVRELRRGGKPEAFFMGTTKLSKDEIDRRFEAGEPEDIGETETLLYHPARDAEIEKLFSHREATDVLKACLALFAKARTGGTP